MDYIQAILLAIVQGATEFIPVSSSGHLVLMRSLFGWSDDGGLLFDVLLHLASLLAVFLYFFTDWWRMLLSVIFWRDASFTDNRRIAGLLILATLPVVVAGPLLGSIMEEVRNAFIVGVIMIGCGGWFMLCEYFRSKQAKSYSPASAAVMGLAQVIAILPGASRSGFTIGAGVWWGLSRTAAARFSFFMVAPTILGAFVLEGRKALLATAESTAPAAMDWLPVIIGMITCFFVSLACIHFCMRLFRTYTLRPFGYYLLTVGSVVALSQLFIH